MNGEKKHVCTCCFMCGTTGAFVHVRPGRDPVKLHKQCVTRYEEWLERVTAGPLQ